MEKEPIVPKGKAGRPKKDFTASMGDILQDKQIGRRLEKFCVDNLILEKNIRHIALWGENYNPYNIQNYNSQDISQLFVSMEENYDAGRPLCDTPVPVWLNEKGEPIVQAGNTRSIIMMKLFPGVVQEFVVEEQPYTDEQKMAENTVRSTQSDMNIAIGAYAMKKTGKGIRAIAAACGKKEGWVSKWMEIAECTIPNIQAYIHLGRIKDTSVASFIHDLRLQEMICEWLDKDSSMVIDSPVRIHTMLKELEQVSNAAYFLPFIEKKYGTLLNINQIQDLFYIHQDDIYTDIYITMERWNYDMFLLNEVQKPQILAAGVEDRIHNVGTISEIPENFWVEPYTEKHWKNSIGVPCFYQYQLVALIADKVSIVAAKAEKAKATTVPSEMILKEMRGRYVDEYLSRDDEQSIENVVHAVCAIHGLRSMEPMELIYELLKHKQRSMTASQLKKLFKDDFDEAYASAEQFCRDKASSVEEKEMLKVELMIQAYCNLYYVKYIAYDKKNGRDNSFTIHINWQDAEEVKSILEKQSYEDLKRHSIERMIEKQAKVLGVQCKFSNKASIKEFKEVQNAMNKLLSLYPEQIKLAIADAAMAYDMYLAKKESETSMLENCESEYNTVESVIAQCKIVDDVVVLPEVQLEKSLYQKVVKKLEGIGCGKWNASKGGFVFFGSHTAELLANLQIDINKHE